MIERQINQELMWSYSDDIPRFLKPLYASRNISESEIALHISRLLPPDFNDLAAAHEILHTALLNQSHIVVVADFDADGATSCALVVSALRIMGGEHVDFLVPNRFIHGYGLSPAIVDIAVRQDAELIITVDNGISSIDGVRDAKAKGIEVIITDHHLPGTELPDASAIINPNLIDCSFPSKSLAGVGVAFYMCSTLKSYLQTQGYFHTQGLTPPNMKQFLDLVALGTIADVVKLDANNKILVHEGLAIIRSGQCSNGIRALLDISKKSYETITATDLAFSVAPKLNASGRMDDISRGIRCLLSQDYAVSYQYAVELNEFNTLRKDTQEQMVKEAEDILAHTEQTHTFTICLHDPQWHEGVVGIVAGKCKEQYGKPSIIFARSGGHLKGSARSIASVHIKDLLDTIDRTHPGLILKFGGHSMAAGLTIAEDNFTQFSEVFENTTKEHLEYILPSNELITDGQLKASDITLEHALLLEQHIWGNGCEEPIFHNIFTIVEQRVVGEQHLKLRVELEQKVFDAIAFFTTPIEHDKIHMSYTLNMNRFNGRETIQLISKEIIIHEQ